ncbi:MAG TPA: UDP-glucose/GDP-mannose dehydrogenase family protein, partial [Candidatus Sulfotelmatobacter sp.]|nr:UDP-glucose/GDP-mannose dehydrogenase family protein [Candidatus Sulfotelmatobacter sp.]
MSEHPSSVAVVGAGYVGLVTAACLAERGHTVEVIESDSARLGALRRGHVPFHEPGLEALLQRGIAGERLRIHGELAGPLRHARIAIIAVGTPILADGSPDLSGIERLAADIASGAHPGTIVAIKSTVPPGTAACLRRLLDRGPSSVRLVSSPEFLREGAAIEDFMAPARLVVGGEDAEALTEVAALIAAPGTPIVRTDHDTAELIKYASNAFLGLKISFVNELSLLCEQLQGDVREVTRGMGLDPRIGSEFLQAGIGFGGSCLGKDLRTLARIAEDAGSPHTLVSGALEVNEQRLLGFVEAVHASLRDCGPAPRAAVLGLSFKPETDDIRESRGVALAQELLRRGITVSVHDPRAMDNATGM